MNFPLNMKPRVKGLTGLLRGTMFAATVASLALIAGMADAQTLRAVKHSACGFWTRS
ncbi:MAG: hypothetical protein WA782_01230 [Sulfitobacter sp.]